MTRLIVVVVYILCALIVLMSLITIEILICDINLLYSEIKTNLLEFKHFSNDAWQGMILIQNYLSINQLKMFVPKHELIIDFKRVKRDCASQFQRCPRGLPGLPGQQGLPGDAGDRGQNGKPGVSGLNLYENSRYECIQCPPGLLGPPGNIGPNGYPGPKGQLGQSGIAGNDGLSGTTGLFGDPGMIGSPGIAGAPGTPGMFGHRGIGKPGLKGFPGLPGNPGQQGPLGVSPKNGKTGLIGNSGKSGSSGLPGPPGPPGPPGLPGLPGHDANYCPCPPRNIPQSHYQQVQSQPKLQLQSQGKYYSHFTHNIGQQISRETNSLFN